VRAETLPTATPETEPNDDGTPSVGNGMGSFEGNDFSSAAANGPYSADTLITAGGVQSNHARATAAAAAKLGMRAVLVANGEPASRLTANALLDGGSAEQCGWLKDRFGLSWQIVPTALGDMMANPDRAKAKRAADAMLKMVKLDIAALQAAYAGTSK